jgi:hypothetical protein
MRRISGLLGALILSVGVMGCGGGGDGGVTNPPPPPPPPPSCATNTFCMGASSFYTGAGTSVNTLTVTANTPVTWDNNSGILHDVTFDDPSTALAVGSGAAGNIGTHTSGTNKRQFAVSGTTHPFHCTQHGLIMHGTVIVQ